MHGATKLVFSVALVVVLVITLTACGASTPPLGLAPTKQLVQKAIAFQVNQSQQQLTQQLQSSAQKFEITQVKLKQLEPLFVEDLPTYHILGTYTLNVKLPQRQLVQENNPFNIYLQRQREGKTWRLALRQDTGKNIQPTWRTYLIP